MGWHRLRDGEVPWGDYGQMLVSGMGSRDPDGVLAIERVGPFVPPVFLSSWDPLVVTDEFRRRHEASGLTGFAFKETRKKRVVRIDWRSWDMTAELPGRLPPDLEPENYILGRKHNQQIADEMGPLWEVVVDEYPEHATGDFARAGWARIVVSERAKKWLEAEAAGWLTFEPWPDPER